MSGDIDGKNISALLLRLFVMYFPQIIEAGMLYKAIPPLYSIQKGKKNKYFIDQLDFVKIVQKDFLSTHKMSDSNKKNVEPKDVTKFLLRNTDYTYFINKISNTYAVEPYLLEMVLYNYIENKNSINIKKLDKQIKSVYRFMGASINNNIPIVKGSINDSNLIICNNKFFNDCRDIFRILEENDSLYYYIDNKKSSILEIMRIYESSMPTSLQRYKGLGEMDPEELAESTMDINNRTLIRYTMDDVKETINLIREYESNTKKILTHVKSVSRDDLLD